MDLRNFSTLHGLLSSCGVKGKRYLGVICTRYPRLRLVFPLNYVFALSRWLRMPASLSSLRKRHKQPESAAWIPFYPKDSQL